MERNLEFAVNLQHYKELGSTNTEAKKLAEQGVAEGTIVIADKQTAGRGRMKRVWESPQGQGL